MTQLTIHTIIPVTIIAVHTPAETSAGIPTEFIRARTEPMTPQCNANAKCFLLKKYGLYGTYLQTSQVPMIAEPTPT